MDSNTSHLLQYIDDKSDMDPLTQEDGLENSAADTACAKGQFSDDKTTASENPQDNKDDKYNPVLPLPKPQPMLTPRLPSRQIRLPKRLVRLDLSPLLPSNQKIKTNNNLIPRLPFTRPPPQLLHRY
jgi:hypothetical protein